MANPFCMVHLEVPGATNKTGSSVSTDEPAWSGSCWPITRFDRVAMFCDSVDGVSDPAGVD